MQLRLSLTHTLPSTMTQKMRFVRDLSSHTLYIIHIHTHTLQPVCDCQYDDSFENMDLDVDGWRSKSNTLKTPFFIIFFSPHIHTHTPSLSLSAELVYDEIKTFSPPQRRPSNDMQIS